MLPKFRFALLINVCFSFICSAQTENSSSTYGKASFYHDKFLGRETSNGETYNSDDFTAAHRTLPFNTILLITNKKNNKSTVVRVNDRGPFIRSRVIDMSHAAAKSLGMVPFGVVPVKITHLNFLDPSIMNDSLLNDGEAWDCYGNKKTISDTAIFIWRTDSWKHAFYMASCLSLENKLNSILVYVSGKPEKRNYDLVISNIEDKIIIRSLVNNFKTSGFSHAKPVYGFGKSSKLHVDQSTK